jgi:hypothetical protein
MVMIPNVEPDQKVKLAQRAYAVLSNEIDFGVIATTYDQKERKLGLVYGMAGHKFLGAPSCGLDVSYREQ